MSVFRFRIQSQGQFSGGALSGARDDGNVAYIGSRFYGMNGTDNSSVLDDLYHTDDYGKTWTSMGSTGIGARNASGIASVPEENCFKIWAGNNFAGTVLNNSYKFTEASGFQVISSSMTGFGTGRTGFAFASRIIGGTRYYWTIGGNNQTNIIVSTNLSSWSNVITLPADLQNMGGISCAFFGGYWWVSTSQTNDGSNVYPGKLYRFAEDFTSYTLVLTNDLFKTKWYTFSATNDAMFLIKGHNTDLGGNQQGVWYNETDPSDITKWKRLPYEHPKSHATPAASDGTRVITFGGNMWNMSGIIERIDQLPL